MRPNDPALHGDRILNKNPDELWEVIDSDTTDKHFDNQPGRQEFLSVARRIPQPDRDSLQQMWNFEYEARNDGGIGLGVPDHLWAVWRLCQNGSRDSHELASLMNMTLNYVEALKRALGL